MAKRIKTTKSKGGGVNYFATPPSNIPCIPTGSTLLDLALGGGWAENRISNIVGDKSSGKTLLAIEAAANFAAKYPKGVIYYRECEAAFIPAYAEALGMPLDRVDINDSLETVEDLFEDLIDVIDRTKKQPALYIVDSLDALSDRAELERAMDEGTFGVQKAKNLSQMFRRTVRALSKSHVTLSIVSQVRSKIGITFGRGTTRSGGRALDFYASQVVYLTSGASEARTFRGIKRPISVDVKARVDKNKVSLPFRDAEFRILFGYGVDDFTSCLKWLKQVNSLAEIGLPAKMLDKEIRSISRSYIAGDDVSIDIKEMHDVIKKLWYEIETEFLPARRKYP